MVGAAEDGINLFVDVHWCSRDTRKHKRWGYSKLQRVVREVGWVQLKASKRIDSLENTITLHSITLEPPVAVPHSGDQPPHQILRR